MRGAGISLRHGCKINLFLRVLDRLPDGYHTIASLFVPLAEPCDRMDIVAAPSSHTGCSVAFADRHTGAPLPHIDPNENTLTKAYAWYVGQTDFAPDLTVTVHKGIPEGAGLGGGSANAACLLDFLQNLACRSGVPPLERSALVAGAAAVGADVPFFLQEKAALAEGIGDRLLPVDNPVAGAYLVLLCPCLSVPTAWAYAALDDARRNAAQQDDSGQEKKAGKKLRQGLTTQSGQATYSLARWEDAGNDFEAVVFARFPELSRLQKTLLELGAKTARMSGTGSSLFGLFPDKVTAQMAAKTLASQGLNVYMQRIA